MVKPSEYTITNSVLEDGDVEYVATHHDTGITGCGFTSTGAYKNMLRALMREGKA